MFKNAFISLIKTNSKYLRLLEIIKLLLQNTLSDKKKEAPRRSYPNGTEIGRSDVHVQKNKLLQFYKKWMFY